MYRCTECHAEYDETPDYCQCGNDIFEEVFPSADDEYEDTFDTAEVQAAPAPKLTKAQAAELAAEKLEKQKSLIAAGVILLLCVLVFFLPPHRQPKTSYQPQAESKENVKLPSVQTYWDDTLPSAFRKKDPLANLPLLNERLSRLSPVLREYLVSIGKYFNSGWDSSVVQGAGSCKVQFVIDKEGGLSVKNIIASSGNRNLDDSVSLLLTNTTGFNIPPDEYKGEKIYILFTVDNNGHSKVSYPSR